MSHNMQNPLKTQLELFPVKLFITVKSKLKLLNEFWPEFGIIDFIKKITAFITYHFEANK